MSSIIETVRAHVGTSEPYFDAQLIDFINAAFFTLNQLGVGPKTAFTITDDTAQWEDFTTDVQLETVKLYVSLYVKLQFDPPGGSYLVDILSRTLREMEYRLMVEAEIDAQNE